MFRKKKWWGRTRGSSKIPARKIPKSIARVRTDWVTVYNPTGPIAVDPGGTSCSYIQAPWGRVTVGGEPQCFSSFGLTVMSADQLTDNYGDDVKIVQMVGDIWMRPYFEGADACFPDDLAALQKAWDGAFIRAKGGLFKQRQLEAGINNPHPMLGRDWSDAGFLRVWEKNWPSPTAQSTATTIGGGQLAGVYGNVNRAAYNTPATADGDQPLFNVPAIQTSAAYAILASEGCLDGPSYTRYVSPGWKRQSLSSRRTIHMHEDDFLTWNIDWAVFTPHAENNPCNLGDITFPLPCAMAFIPQLKIKLQYG